MIYPKSRCRFPFWVKSLNTASYCPGSHCQSIKSSIQPLGDVLQQLHVAVGTSRILRMRKITIDPTAQFEELCGRMFVSRSGCAERKLSQVLQNFVNRNGPRIIFRPQAVAHGESFYRKG